MYKLSIKDHCPVGVNKGLPFSLIYQYCPEFIEWFIKTDIFSYYFDNLFEFDTLPEPTPYYTDEKITTFIKSLDKKDPAKTLEKYYQFPRVDLAINLLKEFNVKPRSYSEQIIEDIHKIESTRIELNRLISELHRLDPVNNPKPEIIEKTDISNIKFSFSDEVFKKNDEKKNDCLKNS